MRSKRGSRGILAEARSAAHWRAVDTRLMMKSPLEIQAVLDRWGRGSGEGNE